MKKLMIACLVVLATAGFAAADALTIDVSGDTWVLSAIEPQEPVSISGVASVNRVATAQDVVPAGILDGIFSLTGVSFTGNPASTPSAVHIYGYLGDSQRYAQPISLPSGFLGLDWRGIDKVIFEVYNGATYVYDGTRLQRVSGGASAPVPEPSTMLLLGTGLLGLVGFKKRLRK